jgi:opacity protein-like surface antigen
MNRKSLLAATLAASALMGIASVAQAVPAVVAPSYSAPVISYPAPGYTTQQIIVQSAPPAPIYEVVPAARAGYSWSPGYYEWRGDRYVWNSGRWIEHREGWAWQQPHWQQRGDGSWYLVGGQWVRTDSLAVNRRGPNGDRDGDGIPNRFDHDRDGDGVPDRYDAYPGNPNRS